MDLEKRINNHYKNTGDKPKNIIISMAEMKELESYLCSSNYREFNGGKPDSGIICGFIKIGEFNGVGLLVTVEEYRNL